MNWISATVKLNELEKFDALYERYAVSTEGAHHVNGTPVEFSYAEDPGDAFTVFPDDAPLSRFRRAELNKGLISEETETGLILRCCWPETLIADLQAAPKPEWLEGIEIIPES